LKETKILMQNCELQSHVFILANALKNIFPV